MEGIIRDGRGRLFFKEGQGGETAVMREGEGSAEVKRSGFELEKKYDG